MGRGRQKAKQQKIARKLKYLTTDTDYDELAKELSSQEPGAFSPDPFADIEAQYAHDHDADADSDDQSVASPAASTADDDLDEYAKWAAEAAAKATSGEFPVTPAAAAKPAAPKPHKPIPMPVPSALKPKKA
ncbi:DUF3073 domain-containing protein [Bifidobacterium amazonense]|uniref:DUF3073 domain-containing protein n=1 Tax=Bifidobacterium amazonense TaxID=2809027 RepID=A0ABS9VYD5_9BIFI|nr:DUF3073 domain-containing protein [Bifidobacterium amazonense]MCH9277127.1 DUF3073 domain-containing protein [Bifidobacterium amazonense]